MKTSFSNRLISWYSTHKRELPWRGSRDPYKIWLSEIILQQTQVSQGLPYYLAFVKAFPRVQDLAQASENEVLKLWQGLGYYSRARNLHHSARQIIEEFDGHFPTTYNELIKLKGVGDYTASAVASICSDAQTAVVDGNVYRLLSRFFGIFTPINSSAGQKQFKALAQELLPGKATGDYNQAVMEFGARQCRPKSPDCSVCVLKTDCYAFNEGVIDELPVKTKSKAARKRYFNYLVVISANDRTIMRQRKGRGIWQNLFEFPLIETESPIEAEKLTQHVEFKALFSELDYDLIDMKPKERLHKLSHQSIYAKFWPIYVEQEIEKSVPREKIHDYPVPVLIANYIKETNFVGSYKVI